MVETNNPTNLNSKRQDEHNIPHGEETLLGGGREGRPHLQERHVRGAGGPQDAGGLPPIYPRRRYHRHGGLVVGLPPLRPGRLRAG